MISNHAPSATRSPLLALNEQKDGIDTPKAAPGQAERRRHGRKATAQPKYAYFSPPVVLGSIVSAMLRV
jgi:hypothetical protein